MEYEYKPGFMVMYPDFEALLSKLYAIVEEENLNKITSKLSMIMTAFSKGENE